MGVWNRVQVEGVWFWGVRFRIQGLMIETLLISLGDTSYSRLQSSKNTSLVKVENSCSNQTLP